MAPVHLRRSYSPTSIRVRNVLEITGENDKNKTSGPVKVAQWLSEDKSLDERRDQSPLTNRATCLIRQPSRYRQVRRQRERENMRFIPLTAEAIEPGESATTTGRLVASPSPGGRPRLRRRTGRPWCPWTSLLCSSRHDFLAVTPSRRYHSRDRIRISRQTESPSARRHVRCHFQRDNHRPSSTTIRRPVQPRGLER